VNPKIGHRNGELLSVGLAVAVCIQTGFSKLFLIAHPQIYCGFPSLLKQIAGSILKYGSQCNSVNTVNRLHAGKLEFVPPARAIMVLFHIVPTPALGSTQRPMQWVPALFPRGWSGRGVKFTTHLHLVPRLRMRGAMPPLLHECSWRDAQLITGCLRGLVLS
jgi:hypothetical protein